MFTVFFEPTDMLRADVPFKQPHAQIQQIKFISPNIYELITIAKALNYGDPIDFDVITENPGQFLANVKKLTLFVNETIDNVIVTLGHFGILLGRKKMNANMAFYKNQTGYIHPYGKRDTIARFYAAPRLENVVNVSGAGDSFASGFIVAMLKELPENVCVSVGFEAAAAALRAQSAVPSRYFDEYHKCWQTPSSFSDTIYVL